MKKQVVRSLIALSKAIHLTGKDFQVIVGSNKVFIPAMSRNRNRAAVGQLLR